MAKRATQHEKNERVDAVYRQLVRGADRSSIVQFVAQTWELSERQADVYIALAHDRLESEAQTRRPRELGKALARLSELYTVMWDAGDYRGALMAVGKHIDLLGLAEASKLELKTPLTWAEFIRRADEDQQQIEGDHE